jgi:hypothetical protein
MSAAARPARRWFGLRPRPYDQCMRCGKATPWGHSVCRECNPAGLPEPSPGQFHATAFAAVIVTVVVLTVIAVLLR